MARNATIPTASREVKAYKDVNPSPTLRARRSFEEIHDQQEQLNETLSQLIGRLSDVNYRLTGNAIPNGEPVADDAKVAFSDVTATFDRLSKTRSLLNYLNEVVDSLETV